MARSSPLLVVYDAENPRHRRWVDWVRRRDRHGLVVAFPFQNPELVTIAPELAGRPLHIVLHGLDTGSREVWHGEALLPEVWRRLPGWGWAVFLNRIPIVRRVVRALNKNVQPW